MLRNTQPGDRVAVVTGSLTGIDGIFEARDSEARAMILIEISQKSTRLTLPIADLTDAH